MEALKKRASGILLIPLSALIISAIAITITAQTALAAGNSFTFLQAGFTQAVYGVDTNFFGGVAFASNGDPLVDYCFFSGSNLDRFAVGSTFVAHGTTLHSLTVEPSNAGCGLTNHPNGTLYSNTGGGVINLAQTGATIKGPFGPPGDALGIATDPQTGNLVYVGSNGTINFVDSALTTTGTFSTVTTGDFIDQIAFDPTGNFLFLSNRSPSLELTILRRDGTLVQNVPVSHEPDGIAFHASNPQFVVTVDTDGTMNRFDFPGNDFTQTPTQSLFASGGFRGDNAQVGPDGCLYLSQDGTRYDNGDTTSENSLVQICGGFAPPSGVDNTAPSCTLSQVIQGPPKQLIIATQDADGGLASITVTEATNATVSVPAFTVGTTNEVDVTATKIDQTQGASVALEVKDLAGNTTDCDPAVLNVNRQTGKPASMTVHGIAKGEHLVHIYNGNPGVSTLSIEVNGKHFEVSGLHAGQQVTIDIGSALAAGSNSVMLTASGAPAINSGQSVASVVAIVGDH